MSKQLCMKCKKEFDRYDLVWIKDNYGIPYNKVCDDCEDEVREEIEGNNYGDELTNSELYGEDDPAPYRLE